MYMLTHVILEYTCNGLAQKQGILILNLLYLQLAFSLALTESGLIFFHTTKKGQFFKNLSGAVSFLCGGFRGVPISAWYKFQ